MTITKTDNTLHKTKAIIAVLFLIVATVVLDTGWKYSIQEYSRSQARNTLEKVRLCLDAPIIDSNTLSDRLGFCAEGVTTTLTGDILAYNLDTKVVMFDPSKIFSSVDTPTTLVVGVSSEDVVRSDVVGTTRGVGQLVKTVPLYKYQC